MSAKMSKWEKYKNRNDIEEDASYRIWKELYIPVYSNISVFKENFDFEKPIIKSSGKINRLAISVKKESRLLNNYIEELKKNIPIELEGIFYISGDTDINITSKNCHRLDNYSLMPVTGALNNEKGKKGIIQDDLAKFIYKFSDLVQNPSAFNGNYKAELKPYRQDIVRCARKAYFGLFNSDITEYCRIVYFYDVNENDGELYEKPMEMIKTIINSKGIYPEEKGCFEEAFWSYRREILNKKYGINV